MKSTKQGRPNVLSASFSFEVGQYFRRGVTVFRIVDSRPPYFILEHSASLDRKYVEQNDLYREFLKKEILPCDEVEAARAISGDGYVEDDNSIVLDAGALSLLSDAAKKAGLLNIKYIRAFRDLGYSCLRPTPLLELEYKRLVAKYKDEDAPKLSTIYTWSRKVDQNDGDWRAAFPRYSSRGGGRECRIHQEAEAILQGLHLELRSNSRKKIRFSEIESDLKKRLQDTYGLNGAFDLMPSRSTIALHTKREFDAYEIYKRQYGKKAADQKFRTWYPRDRATAPLEVVEFDDKDTRVFGIDERSGLPAGRIFLTSGVDQYSTVPLGFSISDQPRNTWSAINAFMNAALPKDMLRAEWSEVKSDVPYFGNASIALFDNALYNHADALSAATLEISNCITAWAKPFTPTEKSAVEDLNGRMVTYFLSNLPGFAGPKALRDQLQEGLVAANLTVGEFNKRFLKWAYDDHCNLVRDGGMTPRQLWETGMRGRIARVPTDIRRVRLAGMLTSRSKLRPEQILFTGLIYQHPRLLALRRKIGHNAYVDFRYHPEHLDGVYVYDPLEREWFWVESVNPEYTANLTLYQHRLIRKMAREAGQKNPAVPELLNQREKLALLVEQARVSKKLRERKWAKRVTGSLPDFGPQSKESKPAKPAEIIVMTDLEYQMQGIEDVEMELGDEGWEVPWV